MLGYPITASEVPESPGRAALEGYLERLIDGYRVLVMDFPNIGKSERIPASELTADRVCAHLLGVADAAGFDRFAWWGYSWGGIVGLQLAWRTDRLTALVCGGWPPLGNLYPKVLESCRATADTTEYQRQYISFYQSLEDWPEADSVKRITCPRIAYFGSEDVIERGGVRMETAALLREHRGELETLGWVVEEIPGRGHSVWTDPAAVVPIVRPFLDTAISA
jgi:pimeloyl-ACP methyl ester carboxylesterase